MSVAQVQGRCLASTCIDILRCSHFEAYIHLGSSEEWTELAGFCCRLRHKPGSISMSIGANNDDSELRQRPGYRNTEFLITTGTCHEQHEWISTQHLHKDSSTGVCGRLYMLLHYAYLALHGCSVRRTLCALSLCSHSFLQLSSGCSMEMTAIILLVHTHVVSKDGT